MPSKTPPPVRKDGARPNHAYTCTVCPDRVFWGATSAMLHQDRSHHSVQVDPSWHAASPFEYPCLPVVPELPGIVPTLPGAPDDEDLYIEHYAVPGHGIRCGAPPDAVVWTELRAEVTCPFCLAADAEAAVANALDAGLEELPAKRCRCGRAVIYKLTDLRTLADTAICPACSLAPTACACDPEQLKQLDADATEEHGPAPTGAQEPSGDGPAWPPVPGTLPARLVYAARALAAVEASLRLAIDDLQARPLLPVALDGLAELVAAVELGATQARSRLTTWALAVARQEVA